MSQKPRRSEGTIVPKILRASLKVKRSQNECVTKMLAAISNLSGSMESFKIEMKGDANVVKRAWNNLNSKMDMSVQHLKGETGKEVLQRKKDNEALETQIESERRKVQEELAFVTDEIKSIKISSNCSAASTRFGLRSGTHAWPPPVGPSWKDTWVRRKARVQGLGDSLVKETFHRKQG